MAQCSDKTKVGVWCVEYGHRHLASQGRYQWVSMCMGWAGVSWRGFDTRKAAEAHARLQNSQRRGADDGR